MCRGMDFLLDRCKYLHTGALAGTSSRLKKYKCQRVQYMDQTFYFFLNISVWLYRANDFPFQKNAFSVSLLVNSVFFPVSAHFVHPEVD